MATPTISPKSWPVEIGCAGLARLRARTSEATRSARPGLPANDRRQVTANPSARAVSITSVRSVLSRSWVSRMTDPNGGDTVVPLTHKDAYR
jgi:hypothetical protein